MALFQHKCMVTHPALWKKMVARVACQLPRKRARNGKPLRDRSLDGGDDLWSSTSNVEMVALMEHFWVFSFLRPQKGGKRLRRVVPKKPACQWKQFLCIHLEAVDFPFQQVYYLLVYWEASPRFMNCEFKGLDNNYPFPALRKLTWLAGKCTMNEEVWNLLNMGIGTS